MSAFRFSRLSAGLVAVVGAVAIAVAAPSLGVAAAIVADSGTSQTPPPAATTNGHGWIG
jgi:hypothetical protein